MVLAVVTAIFLAVWLLFPRLLKPAVVIGEIITVSPAQAEVKLMASGYVVPLCHSVIASKQPGRLESMLVKEGDEVREGQLLATPSTLLYPFSPRPSARLGSGQA